MDNQIKIVPPPLSTKSVTSESIAKKIAEITSGTPKDLHEKQLEKKRTLEITSMLEKVMKYTKEDRQALINMWNKKRQEFEQERPIDRNWAHFDFDMFYVACELLDKPDYKDRPCAVGGENSVLCTANYAARIFGVGSAMPTFVAKKLCPELVLFKPNFDKYRSYSDIFRDILRKFDDKLESVGLDEAYIDMTHHLSGKSLEAQAELISTIRKEIFDRTKLTVSCGVGANKLLAKMGSQVNKPNGQYIIQNSPEVILAFMQDKKVRKIQGIGRVNEYYLKGLGIETAGDILQHLDVLSICFSTGSCEFFLEAAMGLGSIEHKFKQRQSVGKSETFRVSSDKAFLEGKLLGLCEEVQQELEEQGFVSNNVVFSYQSDNYQKKDRTFHLGKYTVAKQCLFEAVIGFMRQEIVGRKMNIRLIGVKCTSLMNTESWRKKSLQSYFLRAREKEEEKKSIAKMGNSSPTQPGRDNGSEHSTSKQSRTELLTEIKEKSQFVCPICNQEVQCMSNLSAFNRHIDKCLKGGK